MRIRSESVLSVAEELPRKGQGTLSVARVVVPQNGIDRFVEESGYSRWKVCKNAGPCATMVVPRKPTVLQHPELPVSLKHPEATSSVDVLDCLSPVQARSALHDEGASETPMRFHTHTACSRRRCERRIVSSGRRSALLVGLWLCIAAADRTGATASTPLKEEDAWAAEHPIGAPVPRGMVPWDRSPPGRWATHAGRSPNGLRSPVARLDRSVIAADVNLGLRPPTFGHQFDSRLRKWLYPLAVPNPGAGLSEPDGGRGIDYSTYFGGQGSDVIHGIVVGDDGAIYVAGGTTSLDFLEDGSTARYGGFDPFVLLLAPDGRQVVRSKVISGSGDFDLALAVYLQGDMLYVAGSTNSSDFPITADAVQLDYRGHVDGFLLKLNAHDLATVYSTYIGGSGGDSVSGVAANALGEVFLTGVTTSSDFPVGSAQAACRVDGDAFLLKLDPSLSSLDYGVCVGGSGEDSPRALELYDDGGEAVLVGVTESSDFPTRQALQPEFGGAENDAFVAVIDQQSGELISATYWGGSFGDEAFGVAMDSSGAAYVVGLSDSLDFPVTRAFDGPPAAELRGFISKFVLGDGHSMSLGYSRLLGGTAPSFFGTAALGVVVDAAGSPVVVGNTNSPDFPVQHAPQPGYAGFGDTFVTVLSGDDGEMGFSTFVGGSLLDTAYGVAVAGDAIYVAGVTQSTDFPVVQPFQGRPYGGDAFLTRIVSHRVASVCLYVTNGNAASVTVLDAARRHTVGVLGDGMLAPSVSAIAVASDGGSAYILERSGVGVAVVDTKTGEVVRRFGTFMIPRDLFLSRDGGTAYVIDEAGLTDFDAANGEPLTTVPMFQASRAAVDQAGGVAYVLGDNGSHVYVIELSDPQIIRDFALGPGSLAVDVALAPQEQLVLVVESLLSQLVARDTGSGAVRWQVPIGPGAQTVVVSPDERLSFVGHRYGTGAVTVVDMGAQRVVALLSFESSVEDLAVTPDGASLYITTGAAGQVWVVDIKTLQVIGSIPIGRPTEKVALGTSRNGCQVEIPCDGDCNGDGEVKVAELVTAVGISLGTVDRSACASLGDSDPVTIDYLVGAVRSSLEGCPAAGDASAIR